VGRDTRVLNRVAIVWKRTLLVYEATCDCGLQALRFKLSEAETWALGHRCEEPMIDDLTDARCGDDTWLTRLTSGDVVCEFCCDPTELAELYPEENR
jgi:hypothetical protein